MTRIVNNTQPANETQVEKTAAWAWFSAAWKKRACVNAK